MDYSITNEKKLTQTTGTKKKEFFSDTYCHRLSLGPPWRTNLFC
jgi:hypothetical protein